MNVWNPNFKGLLLSYGSPTCGVNNKLDNKTSGEPIGSSAFVVSSLQGGYVLEGLWNAVLGSDVDFAVEDLTALTREGGERRFNDPDLDLDLTALTSEGVRRAEVRCGKKLHCCFSSDREWR